MVGHNVIGAPSLAHRCGDDAPRRPLTEPPLLHCPRHHDDSCHKISLDPAQPVAAIAATTATTGPSSLACQARRGRLLQHTGSFSSRRPETQTPTATRIHRHNRNLERLDYLGLTFSLNLVKWFATRHNVQGRSECQECHQGLFSRGGQSPQW